jgi:putative acetyltransferase
MSAAYTFRPYRDSDEDAAIALWLRTWTEAYPDIDFAQRLAAWRLRWHDELAPSARITLAEQDGRLAGFVTVDATGYLDQLVVNPDLWGSELGNALIAEAKRLSPAGLTLLVNTDNARAIRFYARNGFAHTHDDVNPISGRKVYGMKWVP